MYSDGKIWVGLSDKKISLLPQMANRHGLIAGATGTGKTITMKVLAESFSAMGVPVFLSDIKGDLSGACLPGADSESMRERVASFGIESFAFTGFPTRFWDVFGEMGTPVRMTVSDMGPVLLAKLLGLTEIQAGVLNIVFRVADDNGLALLDLKDLRAMLQYAGENRAEFTTEYGNVSAASVGAIQRALLAFEEEGGEGLFGEPMLDIRDWIRTDMSGRGYINILESSRLINSPNVYATFLLWMLTELFEVLPEIGDPEKPRLVFFFDEAHLLFDGANKSLVQKITQVVKLIRSKGVGVYFVTQSPSDIPGEVLAQLSNRIQHALRAYTPAELKAVKTAANSFRANPAFDTAEAITMLGVGEALISCLDEEGIPAVVERARVLPPQSLMGQAPEGTIDRVTAADEFDLKYRETVDRESAYEIIMQARTLLEEQRQAALEEAAAAREAEKAEKEAARAAEKAEREAAKQAEKEEREAARLAEKEEREAAKQAEREAKAAEREAAKKAAATKKTMERAVTSATSSLSRSVTTNLVNSITGGKTTSAGTMAKRAATNALSSLMRSGTSSIVRGIFGTKSGK